MRATRLWRIRRRVLSLAEAGEHCRRLNIRGLSNELLATAGSISPRLTGDQPRVTDSFISDARNGPAIR
jgi:hypothetical protein